MKFKRFMNLTIFREDQDSIDKETSHNGLLMYKEAAKAGKMHSYSQKLSVHEENMGEPGPEDNCIGNFYCRF